MKELLGKVGILLFALRKIWFLLFFYEKLHLEKGKKFTWIQMNFLVACVPSIWKDGGLSGHSLDHSGSTLGLVSRDIPYGH